MPPQLKKIEGVKKEVKQGGKEMTHWRIPQKVYLAIILAGLIAFPLFQLQAAGGTSSSLKLYSSGETALDITTNYWTTDAIKTTTGNSWFGGNIRVGKGAVNPNDENGIFYLQDFTNPTSHKRGVHTVLRIARTGTSTPLVAVGGEFQAYVLPTNTQNWTSQISLRGSDSEVFTMLGSTGVISGAADSFLASTTNGATIDKLYGVFYGGDIGTTGIINTQYGIYLGNYFRGTANYGFYNAATNLDYAIFSVGGRVHLAGLPTSDPGIAGDLWSDNGTLKISSGTP